MVHGWLVYSETRAPRVHFQANGSPPAGRCPARADGTPRDLAGARSRNETRGLRRVVTVTLVCSFAAIFALKTLNYLRPKDVRPHEVASLVHRFDAYIDALVRNASFLHHCDRPTRMISVPGGWQCAAPVADGTPYDRIFRTYPTASEGKAHVYASTRSGSAEAGAALLNGLVSVDRYRPVAIGLHPTWSEDPYHSNYWRFNYYALRPTEDLLSAFLSSGDAKYARALLRLDLSFFAAEPRSRFAWVDPHAVAFRSMVLVDEWWALREHHELTEAESTAFLRELQKTGRYLSDRNHYQPGANHGVNESVALLELALDFPTLPGARSWRMIAQTRLREGLAELVDADGSLIENAPFYHFYTLEKYWQLLQFTDRAQVTVAPDLRQKIARMVSFGTYVLRPDSSVPLLGASLATTIHDRGVFARLTHDDPAFEYVLTHGTRGQAPPRTSVFFPHAGLTILRSGWGKGRSFGSQSQLTFNVGAYRTAHSQLDGLSVTLFGEGRVLIPAPGLYVYPGRHPGALFRYFHGTASHNTVVVDGRDQIEGAVSPGEFHTRAGVTWQSAESSLYPGVIHRRLVAMLDASHYLVLDRLSSSTTHDYRQLFHLFPGAHVSLLGSTATARSQGSATPSLTISQLGPVGGSEALRARWQTPRSLCSSRYKQAVECQTVAYLQHGKTAEYTTLLTIGHPRGAFSASLDRRHHVLHIVDGSKTITFRLRLTQDVPAVAKPTHLRFPAPASGIPLPASDLPADWIASGTGAPLHEPDAGTVASITTSGQSEAVLENDHVHADLLRRNVHVRLRVNGADHLSVLTLELSNRHWSSVAISNLTQAYTYVYDGEWLTISLARSELRDRHSGGWVTKGAAGFDWSQIDGVRIRAETSQPGRAVSVQLASIRAVPQQAHGAAVFVFDDGWDSILPAATYLHKYHAPGNVAVIGMDTSNARPHRLNRYDLQMLQDRWGWNIVNHTQDHRNAVTAYAGAGGLAAYRLDILQGAKLLQDDHLDSAPDWLIYPHGAIDARLEHVVNGLYRFARTTNNAPDAYPFGDPLRIKTLEVFGDPAHFTTPAEVARAARDAVRFRSTLILTFHRIHSRASDGGEAHAPTTYPLTAFEQLVDRVRATGIKIVTLTGLERMLGVPLNNRLLFHPGRPSQIEAAVSIRDHGHRGFWAWLGL